MPRGKTYTLDEIKMMKSSLAEQIDNRIDELNTYYAKQYPNCPKMKISNRESYLRILRREHKQKVMQRKKDSEILKLDSKIKRIDRK